MSLEMTAADQSKAPAPYEVRFSPNLKREERRRELRAGLLCLLLSCAPIIDAFVSIKHHKPVDIGTILNHFFVPPWVAIVMGVLLALIGACVMYPSVRRDPTPTPRQRKGNEILRERP